MDLSKQLIENFKSSSAKFLVLFAIIGIAISIQAVYDSLDNNVEKKIDLLDKWEKRNYKKIPDSYMDELYEQVLDKLKNTDKDGTYAISQLNQKATYFPLETLCFKFLAGGALYLFVYGLQMFYIIIRSKKYGKLKISAKDIIGRNRHVLRIWLILSSLNMIIPMLTTPINYVFIPSCLTLLYAVGEIICKEAGDNTPINDKVDTSGIC